MDPVVIRGWPSGMDNIHADHELDAKTLRRAVNADVLDSGKIRRRKGFSPFLADPISRNLRANFLLSKITVLNSGKYFEESMQPISVDLTDGTGTKTFPIYNRRTGLPAAGGQTRQYDILTRDLMSLFFATAADSGVA